MSNSHEVVLWTGHSHLQNDTGLGGEEMKKPHDVILWIYDNPVIAMGSMTVHDCYDENPRYVKVVLMSYNNKTTSINIDVLLPCIDFVKVSPGHCDHKHLSPILELKKPFAEQAAAWKRYTKNKARQDKLDEETRYMMLGYDS